MDNEEQQAPVEEVREEQEVNEVNDVTEEVVSEESQETEEPVQETEETYSDPVSEYANLLPNQPYQFNNTQDGYIDPSDVAAQIEQRVLQQVSFQRQEARMWESIEKKHPQVAKDKDLREMILNQRIAEAVQGKSGNLVKIADSVMSRFSNAKGEGRAEASVSRKVQKAASLETSSSNTGEVKSNDVMDRISRGDQTATTDLLNKWISEGKI